MDVNNLDDNVLIFILFSSDGCEQLWTNPNSPKLPSMIHLLAFLPFWNVLCRQAGRVWKHDGYEAVRSFALKVFQVRQIINPNLQNMELTPPHTIRTYLQQKCAFYIQCLFAFVSCSRFPRTTLTQVTTQKRIKS